MHVIALAGMASWRGADDLAETIVCRVITHAKAAYGELHDRTDPPDEIAHEAMPA
jgi:hypothetical protein